MTQISDNNPGSLNQTIPADQLPALNHGFPANTLRTEEQRPSGTSDPKTQLVMPAAKAPALELLAEYTDEELGRTERVSAYYVNNVGTTLVTEIIMRRKDATKTIFQHSVTSVFIPLVKVGESRDANGVVMGKTLVPIR
jgi:hypothetical protein